MRHSARVAAGLAAACAAALLLIALGLQAEVRSLDLSWLYGRTDTSAKQDRLPVTQRRAPGELVMAFHRPREGMTIVVRGKPLQGLRDEGALPLPPLNRRPSPVREIPSESSQEKRLLEGCEPSFSPVIVPALAHVSGRCLS